MNRKGFTLIEIIVVISLISIIGIATGIIVVNNNKNKDIKYLDKINKKLLDAVDVFISTEKDDSNDNYSTAINNGAKGLKIPISYLTDKGYITSDLKNDIYSYNKLDNGKNYYVLAVNGGTEDNQQYCNSGEITLTLSWMIDSNPIYLCKEYKSYKTVIEVVNNIQQVQNNTRLKVTLSKNAVSDDYYDSVSDTSSFVKDENGIFTLNDENVNKIYTYYRGAVDNNYLKMGSYNGKDLYWRIVWMNEDNKMKLVLDEEVPLTLIMKNGNSYVLKPNDDVIDMYKNSNHYYILNSYEQRDPNNLNRDRYDDYEYIIHFDTNNLLNSMIDLEYPMNNSSNFYFMSLQNWYNSTNLNTYDYITNSSNFCKNDFYNDKAEDYERYLYEPSETFACKYGRYSKYSKDKTPNYENASLFYSSPVGFLTYGDVLRAGISDNKTNIVNSKNYLLNDENNTYPLVDYYKYEFDSNSKGLRDSSSNFYFVSNTGLNTGNFYSEYRSPSGEDYDYYYSLVDQNNTTIFPSLRNAGKNGWIYYESTFRANTIKPSVIIELTNKELVGTGTKTDPYTVGEKK